MRNICIYLSTLSLSDYTSFDQTLLCFSTVLSRWLSFPSNVVVVVIYFIVDIVFVIVTMRDRCF